MFLFSGVLIAIKNLLNDPSISFSQCMLLLSTLLIDKIHGLKIEMLLDFVIKHEYRANTAVYPED